MSHPPLLPEHDHKVGACSLEKFLTFALLDSVSKSQGGGGGGGDFILIMRILMLFSLCLLTADAVWSNMADYH